MQKMEPLNEEGLDARKNIEPKPANNPPADATVEAVSIQGQNSTSGKLLPEALYFRHKAGAPWLIPEAFHKLLGRSVQQCELCGHYLSSGPEFFEVGSSIYIHLSQVNGLPVKTILDQPPKSRFVVSCYCTMVAAEHGFSEPSGSHSWNLAEVLKLPLPILSIICVFLGTALGDIIFGLWRAG
jgi:hypothetical protein